MEQEEEPYAPDWNCTHFCKWDDAKLGGRWFECTITSDEGESCEIKVHDGDTANILKSDMVRKSGNDLGVEAGDRVIAYCDNRPYAFAALCIEVCPDGVLGYKIRYDDGEESWAYN